ncbi:hypothetical protein SNEBB_004992 [Seison nebaliae]|nr:hypothetical protein SNEBB_004992 [Seison nebaliae]
MFIINLANNWKIKILFSFILVFYDGVNAESIEHYRNVSGIGEESRNISMIYQPNNTSDTNDTISTTATSVRICMTCALLSAGIPLYIVYCLILVFVEYKANAKLLQTHRNYVSGNMILGGSPKRQSKKNV